MTVDETREGIQAGQRAALRAALLYACMLDSIAWGMLVPPPGLLDDPRPLHQSSEATAREARRDRRKAKRGTARLDLPEQIW